MRNWCLFIFFALFILMCIHLQAQEKSLDELLSLDMADLLNVKVVSALKGPETIRRVPATVRVITAEQIRANGYFTLEDALADLPGFQFRNILGFNSYVFMRGVPGQNNKILLLVDGIQINELNSGGFYAGGQFNLGNVDRIEVVYGPASALYGTNAVSGIISIFTRDPEKTEGGRARILAGNFATGLADFHYGVHDKNRNFGFNISAMVKKSEKADLKGKNGDFNWSDDMENFENDLAFDGRFHYKNFNAGILFQDKDASRATVQVGIPGQISPSVSDHGVNWHIRFLNAWITYAYDKKKTWSIRSTAYYRNSTVMDDTIPVIELPSGDSLGRQYRYYRPNHLVGNEIQFGWIPNPRWRFSFGLVLEQERLADAYSVTESDAADECPSVPEKPHMMSNGLASGYGQAQVSLSQALDLFLGIRHDVSSYYGTVDTPRLGLVYNRGRLTAKVLYMQAFRAPKPWDYTDGSGNPGLKPEKNHSFEAAGGWSFSNYLRFDISAYHNRLDNLLTRVYEEDDWRWTNSGILKTDGVEANLEYRRDRVKAYINYTYTRSRNDLDEQVPEIAPHGANWGIHYTFGFGLGVGIRGQYLGERKNSKLIATTGSDLIQSALVLHGVFSYKFPGGFDLQLVVNNLLNTVYYHPSNLPPSRYRQPQRSFRLQLGYSL